jgi:hypothetical protein
MDDDRPRGLDDAVLRLRPDWAGRLSTLRAPGGDARLRRVPRSPADLRGTRAQAPEPEPRDARQVLAKAARRTARWLGLDAEVFETATGLELDGESVPTPETDRWDRCFALVQLGGRLERSLGRRGIVLAWLHGRHVQLRPTPVRVLGTAGGLQAINDYLDQFER